MSIDPFKFPPNGGKLPDGPPQPPVTGWDPGNPFLAEGPAALLTTNVHFPGQGQRMIVTIRTSSATVSAFADKETALKWAKQIKADAEKMSGSGLITAP